MGKGLAAECQACWRGSGYVAPVDVIVSAAACRAELEDAEAIVAENGWK